MKNDTKAYVEAYDAIRTIHERDVSRSDGHDRVGCDVCAGINLMRPTMESLRTSDVTSPDRVRTSISDAIVARYLNGESNGGLMDSLMKALVNADLDNQRKIERGYPALVASYRHAWSVGHQEFLLEVATSDIIRIERMKNRVQK